MAPKQMSKVGDGMLARRETASEPHEARSNTRDAAPPPMPGMLQEVLLDKVLEQLDLAGLTQKIIDEVAVKLAGQVRVETIIETVLRQAEHGLSERLAERVLEHLAHPMH